MWRRRRAVAATAASVPPSKAAAASAAVSVTSVPVSVVAAASATASVASAPVSVVAAASVVASPRTAASSHVIGVVLFVRNSMAVRRPVAVSSVPSSASFRRSRCADACVPRPVCKSLRERQASCTIGCASGRFVFARGLGSTFVCVACRTHDVSETLQSARRSQRPDDLNVVVLEQTCRRSLTPSASARLPPGP